MGSDIGDGRPMRSSRHFLERVTGIEPAPPAWKAGALPLSYTRAVLVKGSGPRPIRSWAGATVYTCSGFWSLARDASTSAPINTASALRNNQSRTTTIEASVPYVLL